MRRNYRMIITLLLFAFSLCRIDGETKNIFVFKYYDKSVYEIEDDAVLFLDYVSDYIADTLSANDDVSYKGRCIFCHTTYFPFIKLLNIT